MIKKKDINKLFNISRLFLKKRPYISNLGNNFLFLQSPHPVHMSKYKFVNSRNLNFFFYLSYIFELGKNLTKICLFFFKIIFSKNYFNINKNFYSKTIVVSHLTNLNNFKKNIDTQYFGIEKVFGKKKSIFFYLDHINTSDSKKSSLLKIKKNIFINNYCTDISTYKKILFNITKEFFFIFNKIKKNNNFEKKFYLECAKYLLSLSTVKNIILYYNLEKLIIHNKVKNILITLEGHPYEYLIFLLGNIHNINVYSYQTSYITKSHYSMFLNIGNNFLPTKILANGKIGYDFLKKKFSPSKVILLGSNKYKKKITRKKINNFNILALPSAYEGEASEFIELCYRCLQENKNLKIKIIFRLHPQIDKLNFVKKNSKILDKEHRIKISNTNLINDINLCKFALYRSSSAIVDALQQGLIPIFFNEKKTNFQSDPLWQLKSKIIVKNYFQLFTVLNNKSTQNKREYLECINFANNYYKPVNYRKIKSIL